MKPRHWPAALAIVGSLILASLALQFSLLGFWAQMPASAIDLLLIGGAGVGFILAAIRNLDRPMAVDRAITCLWWMAGFSLLFVAIGSGAVYTGSERVEPHEWLEVLHLTVSTGLFAGLVVGALHTEVVHSEKTTARARAKAEALEEEQHRLDRMNDLLRHYILNAVNVISGYTTELRADVPAGHSHMLDAIEDRAEMMATLIEHIHSIQRIEGEQATVSVDVVVRDAIERVEDDCPVTIETNGELPTVTANPEGLEAGIGLLCRVAAETVDSNTRTGAETTTPKGEITVSFDRVDGTVAVAIECRGGTLPSGVIHATREPVGTGLGLQVYLAQRLLDDAGEIRIEEMADGIRFVISLPTGVEGPRSERVGSPT